MKINRKELLNALKAAQPGLAEKEGVVQSQDFVFNKERVFTFNNEVAVSHAIKTNITGAVPAKEFYQLINKVNSEEIELDINDNELLLKGSRAKAGLRLEGKIKLPLEELGMPEKWGKLPENFCEAIQFCLFTASRDPSKEVLTCLYVTNDYIESGDNYRITRKDISTKIFKEPILLPASSAKEVIDYSPTEFAVTDGWAHFKNSKTDVIYSCRIWDGEYPDQSKYLNVTGKKIQFPSTILDIMDRASVLSDGDRASIIVADNKLTVKTENMSGWFEEVVRVKFDDSLEFEIQPDFMKSIIKINNTAIIGKNLMKFEGDSFQHVVSFNTKKSKSKE